MNCLPSNRFDGPHLRRLCFGDGYGAKALHFGIIGVVAQRLHLVDGRGKNSFALVHFRILPWIEVQADGAFSEGEFTVGVRGNGAGCVCQCLVLE